MKGASVYYVTPEPGRWECVVGHTRNAMCLRGLFDDVQRNPTRKENHMIGTRNLAVTFPRFCGQLVKTWCQSLELDRAV
jgi:hypothetical protein